MQCVAVANTDEEAHRLYGPHILNMFRTGLGSIPLPTLGLPGYVDIKGVEFLAKDPGDFGIVPRLRHIDYSEILDNQCVLVGSPATVKQQLLEMAKNFRIGNLVLTIQLGSMPPELSKMNIELLAKEVLPDLRKLWADDNWQHHWWPEGAA
jgi:alkanesulfonate monooxygenase SsuD/methylene tetrahydromethanopterin reductase-like flavin-dependent oxidoreductase (luciferase family)